MSTPTPNDTFEFAEHSPQNEAALAELTSAIAFGQGADTITLLLVRCNYGALRERMVAALVARLAAEALDGPVHTLRLAPQNSNLYAQVRAVAADQRPGAVLVLGTEGVDALDVLLVEMNKRREEFRRDFPFPLVLWFTDDGYRQLSNYANDFESIAGGETIEFRLGGAVLTQQLEAAAQRLFEALLAPDRPESFNRRLIGLDLGCLRPEEVAIALADLQAQGTALPPDLQASVAFARGLNIRNEDAIALFDQSAAHWAGEAGEAAALKRGLALFYLGRARYFAADNEKYQTPDWLPAVAPLETALEIFEQAQRPDLMAQGMIPLARVLHRLERWDDLEALIQRAIPLHEAHSDSDWLAQDYGFLADVALSRQHWPQAATLAQQALDRVPMDSWWRILYLKMLAQAAQAQGQLDAATEHLQAAQALGVREHPKLHSDVLALLQQCLRDQGRYLEAFEVKRERLAVEQQYGLRAFIGAGRLRSRRTEQRATVRSERQSLEAIAPEIAASGRQQDLETLLQRIAGKEHKLIVLHGASGVGKSSLVNGGLLPALHARAMDNRVNVPVLIRQYTDWAGELTQQLAAALEIQNAKFKVQNSEASSQEPQARSQEPSPPAPNHSPTQSPSHPSTHKPKPSGQASPTHPHTLPLLRHCEDLTLRPVLIFDQFEEFFFANPDPVARQGFFEFLVACLELQPSALKIVLSLREDYIHYLLEARQAVRRLDLPEGSMARSQLGDILGKQILYEIANFSPEDATAIIESLTAGSRMYLEPDLVTALVADLAGPLGEVRPIEMQIVGAQLQTESIQTLAQYRRLGDQPKETLVQRYLQDVVEDCGEEHRQLAELVLFLLTDERGTRPLKTRPELVRDLEALGIDWQLATAVPPFSRGEGEISATASLAGESVEASGRSGSPPSPPLTKGGTESIDSLDLVLKILGGSGIAVQLPDSPDDRYQLVHDYLAGVIRERQAPQLEALVAELEQEKQKRQEAESEKSILAVANQKARRRLVLSSGLLAVSLIAALWTGLFARNVSSEARRAQHELQQTSQDRDRLEAEAVVAKAEAETARTNATQAEEEIRSARAELFNLESQIVNFQQEQSKFEGRLSLASSELKKIQKERLALIEEQALLTAREKELRQNLDTSSLELSEIEDSLFRIRTQLVAIEKDLINSISSILRFTREQTQGEVVSAVLYVTFTPFQETSENSETHISLWLIGEDETSIKVPVYSATEDAVTEAVRKVGSCSSIRFDDSLSELKKLYEWMIEPVQNDLENLGINNIVFLMDEDIRTIPIAALNNGEGFFVEDYSFGIMPGLTFPDARYVNLKNSHLLISGVGKASLAPANEAQRSFGDLRGVDIEVEQILSTWPEQRVRVISNEESTFSSFLALRQDFLPQIVHLATNGGYYEANDNEFSPYLLFWDRILEPQNIFVQDWYSPPIDLLVLSTGQVGQQREGNEFGIAGSFLNVGVKSVMADLFCTNDLTYATLMAEFYSNLKTAPTRSEALRRHRYHFWKS
jgi:CHAT domain-containing protein